MVLNLIIDLKLEGKLVNGNLTLTGIVLEGAREEGLWEEEPRDPESRRGSLFNPLGKEGYTVV